MQGQLMRNSLVTKADEPFLANGTLPGDKPEFPHSARRLTIMLLMILLYEHIK